MSKFYTDPRTQYGNISHQATVVIQCTQDKRDMVERMRIYTSDDKKKDYYVHSSAATLDNSVCRIDRGDLVFRIGTSSVPRGNLLNNAPPVSSCVNGLAVRKGKKDKLLDAKSEDENNLKLAEGIQVLGVSLGATSPNPEEGSGLGVKNQITVRTQGTTTLFNNGNSNFVPGDTVIWKIPTRDEIKDSAKRFGRNSDKVMLRLEPLSMFYKNFDDGFKESLKWKTKNDHSKNVKTTVDHFNLQMKKFIAQSVFHSQKSSLATTTKFDDVWKFLDPAQNLGDSAGPLTGIVDTIKTTYDSMAADDDDVTTDALTAFVRVQSDVNRRRVGKCLSYSKPNTGVDVLLGTA